MPKKQPRNAFYFYMLDFKEEQRRKGVIYQNLAAVAEAAGPLWKEASPPVRAKFETMAKREKAKYNVPEQKYTSTGISYAEIEAQAREVRTAEEREKKDIKNIVKLKAFSSKIHTEDFVIMDVNTYCRTDTGYVICEFTVLRFNLKEGIKDEYHEMVNPGSIPVGYASDAKIACKELGVDMPDPDEKISNYLLILANLMDYMRVGNPDSRAALPPIYTLPDKVAAVSSFVQELCRRSRQDDSMFRVYRLDTLFFTLINTVKSREKEEGFPKESLAMSQLKKDPFKYNPGLCCEHHQSLSIEREDKAVECTMSRVKRWAFTILDHCCPVAGIEQCPGTHMPADYDISQILTYKEQKQQRAGPSVGSYSASCNSSIMSDSLNETWPALSIASGTTDPAGSKPKRTHKPLRMPKTDFSKNIRQAPELTESNFPTLSMGPGRGRGQPTSQRN